MLTHAPADQQTWLSYNFFTGLGLSESDYPNTLFPVDGRTNKQGVTNIGLSLNYDKAEMWNQDYSIFSWTAGNVLSSGNDVAKFYYELMEKKSIVSEARLIEM